jgi:hypothetical protein
MTEAVAIGLEVRTGRAVAVLLRGTPREPVIVLRHEIHLADPWVPESMHPYHHELGNRTPEGALARRRGTDAARKAARHAIRTLVLETRSHGLEPRGAAVVVASLEDPARVRGAHPRAHAEERKLYRESVESELAACGLVASTFIDKKLRAEVRKRLGRSAREVDATLKAFSHGVGTPWRAPEKHAALAAWLALPESGRAP